MTLVLRPITLREARRFVAERHRHSEPDTGWIVGVGVEHDGDLVGVGVLGRPKAHPLQDGRTGRDCIAIDLDGRNANLAVNRVGMFLTVEHHAPLAEGAA